MYCVGLGRYQVARATITWGGKPHYPTSTNLLLPSLMLTYLVEESTQYTQPYLALFATQFLGVVRVVDLLLS